jgi:D-glycero-D-manno-heptose 1,7-bisphosphate phosphatase
VRPQLFIFDADGTLRRTTVPGQPCPDAPDQWQLMPLVQDRLRTIPWEEAGCALGIASNQGGVALGYLTRECAHQLLVDMVVGAIGFVPSRTYIELCTCSITANCDCRKPAPGMLLRILKRSGIPADRAIFVGDAGEDVEAARRAGIGFRWAKDFFGWPDARPDAPMDTISTR